MTEAAAAAAEVGAAVMAVAVAEEETVAVDGKLGCSVTVISLLTPAAESHQIEFVNKYTKNMATLCYSNIMVARVHNVLLTIGWDI